MITRTHDDRLDFRPIFTQPGLDILARVGTKTEALETIAELADLIRLGIDNPDELRIAATARTLAHAAARRDRPTAPWPAVYALARGHQFLILDGLGRTGMNTATTAHHARLRQAEPKPQEETQG